MQETVTANRTRPSRVGAVIAGLSLVAVAATGPARADQAAGDSCAGTLTPHAKAVYEASVSDVMAGKPIVDTLRTRARGMVIAGTLPMDDARPSAEAAAACLKKLR